MRSILHNILAGAILLVLAAGLGCHGDGATPRDPAEDTNPAPDVAEPAQDAEPRVDAGADLDAGGRDSAADAAVDAAGDGDDGGALPGPVFSFAVLADPHLDGTPSRRENLQRAVDRIVAEREAWGIELVFIAGDIAWGSVDGMSNLADAREILEGLEEAGIHYVPLLGDNEVQYGSEQEFHQVFGPHYQDMAAALKGWQQLATPVDGLYLQSFSFNHRGCHFVCPDFISRQPGNEAADLNDFEGGSWPWFQADVTDAAQGPKERINVFSHHGMFNTGLASVDRLLISDEAMDQVVELLCPLREFVSASYGGHIHQNWVWEVYCDSGEPIYQVWMTDDAFDAVVPPEPDDHRITIRVVEVSAAAGGFTYEQHLLEEPVVVE